MADDPDVALEHAWRYFQLHADQRISVFNFFVAIASLLAAGIAFGLQGPRDLWPLGGVASFLMIVLAFVFWKLDQRVSGMIKVAEDVIVGAESVLISDPSLRTMSRELNAAGALKKGGLRGAWTYGQSFRLIFGVVALVGFLGMSIYVVRSVWPVTGVSAPEALQGEQELPSAQPPIIE